MANTTKNIRFTPEFKQERISRRQLQERIVEFGWLTAEPELDLGEEHSVRDNTDQPRWPAEHAALCRKHHSGDSKNRPKPLPNR